MAEGKNSFVLYAEYLEIFEELNDEDAGQLAKHLFRYVNDKEPQTDNQFVKLAFIPIKQALKRDLKKYDLIRQKRSEAGKASAEARAKTEKKKATKSTSVEGVNLCSTNPTDNDNDNDNDNVNDSVNEKKTIINNAAFVKSCKVKSQWSETTAMKFKVSEDVINVFLDQFEKHLITMEEQKKSEKEFKAHFIHWLNKQPLEAHISKPVGKSNQRQLTH